jgi:SAM-dependent methyltransferase
LAYAYNVVEHVADPARFLTSVNQILRPGGVFWALTPHGRHPFCWLARITEQVGGKARARERLRQDTGYTVNAYPSYYRLNTRRAVERNAGKIGFSGGRFEYYPCLQWDTYFPDFMRWIPHAYDYVAGIRWPACMLVFAFRLQKQKLT